MLVSIDDYYNVDFYNECVQALKNNGVEFSEYISTVSPYKFYFEVENPPTFVNYDEASTSYARHLVNIVRALKPNDDYLYLRRASYVNKKAVKQYAINDALGAGQKSGEGVFFTATKEDILRMSREYPRKIWFMGRYFNRRYKVFFADSLMVKNYVNEKDVMIASDSFGLITELEAELNYKYFMLQDRLLKISQTPYVKDGRFYPVNSVRPEISDKYVLS